MRWYRKLTRIALAALRRSKFERDVDAELACHLACETEEWVARGLTPTEARRRALAAMGRIDAIKEECRDARGTAGWEDLKQDVAFGFRLLWKHHTFSAMALLTMALGIGSTTAVYSVCDAVLVRPLPFPQPERLYSAVDMGTPGPFDTLRANSRAAEYASNGGVREFSVKGRDWPERVKGSEVSANLFHVLGVKPMLGTSFGENDDRPGRNRLAVLSYSFWRERYGLDPKAVGQDLTLDEVAYRIAGVMPAHFRYPAAEVNFWVPAAFDARDVGSYWGSGGLSVVARLRDGVSPAAADAELRAWVPKIRALFPWPMPNAWGADARLAPLKEQMIAGVRVRSLLLLGVVVLVLLIAVANVANLFLGQAAARQRELTMRVALGATPGRLARQMLTEAMLLALAGGLCGIALAFAQLEALKKLLPADMPGLAEVSIDGRILAAAVCLSAGTGLVLGLFPAWVVRRQQSLAQGESTRATQGSGARRMDGLLVALEAAFATVPLVGAGLLLHSFVTALRTDFGFDTESLVTAELSPDRAAAASVGKTQALFERVRARLGRYPGVTDTAAMNALPLTPEFSAFAAAVEDHPRAPSEPQFSLWSTQVTPGHLKALGIRLLQGRGFTDSDGAGAAPVALIDRKTAHRFWPGRSPVGKHIRPVWQAEWRTIVGVVDEVRAFSVSGPPEWADGQVYLPLAQSLAPPGNLALVIRMAGDPEGLEKNLPGMVKEVCQNCALSRVARMREVVDAAVAPPRSMAWLVGAFALLAIVLAGAGIYGVVSHAVVRRTREIGVRLALGSSRSGIAWLVFGTGLRFTALGAGAGLAAAWVMARWIRTLLYGVAVHDQMSFSLAPAVLVLAALAASVVPMWRAAGIAPAESLREG